MGNIVTVNAVALNTLDDTKFVPKPVYQSDGMKVLTELTVLHVVAPPPSDKDHHEVRAGIAEGKFD